jgi:hypothetical protein
MAASPVREFIADGQTVGEVLNPVLEPAESAASSLSSFGPV